jgi:hypothetical protein
VAVLPATKGVADDRVVGWFGGILEHLGIRLSRCPDLRPMRSWRPAAGSAVPWFCGCMEVGARRRKIPTYLREMPLSLFCTRAYACYSGDGGAK